MILSIVLFIICSKDDGETSLAQRAIEATKEADDKENVTTIPVIDHSYDPFPVTSEERAYRNPFAEDQPTRKLSQEQDEPNTAVKSRTPLLYNKVVQQISHHSRMTSFLQTITAILSQSILLVQLNLVMKVTCPLHQAPYRQEVLMSQVLSF